jgi:hypothetical protein
MGNSGVQREPAQNLRYAEDDIYEVRLAVSF